MHAPPIQQVLAASPPRSASTHSTAASTPEKRENENEITSMTRSPEPDTPPHQRSTSLSSTSSFSMVTTRSSSFRNSILAATGRDPKSVPACERCNHKFTIVKHRHFCQHCAGIFCSTCCPKPQGSVKVRICVICENAPSLEDSGAFSLGASATSVSSSSSHPNSPTSPNPLNRSGEGLTDSTTDHSRDDDDHRSSRSSISSASTSARGSSFFSGSSNVKNCGQCGDKFSIAKRRHQCTVCNEIYCNTCCPKDPRTDRRECVKCVQSKKQVVESKQREKAEAERRENLAKLAAESLKQFLTTTAAVEDTKRKEYLKAEAVEFKKISKIFGVGREKLEKQQLAWEADTKQRAAKEELGRKMDYWSTVQGPRCGSLTLTVARCQNLHAPRFQLFDVNSSVQVKCPFVDPKREPLMFESNVVKFDRSPDYDFTVYCQTEDDTLPIMITVRDWSVGYPRKIAHSLLNLRGTYNNLVRSITKEGVYEEKGHVVLDLWDSGDTILEDSSITVRWVLELRELNKTKFCSDCGRLEVKCECTEEDREKRRAEEAKRMEAQHLAENDAREARMAGEKKREEEEMEAARQALIKALEAKLADLEAEQKEVYLDLNVSEHRARELVDHEIRESFHHAKECEQQRKNKATQMKMCLGSVARNKRLLRSARFQVWKAFLDDRKEARRKAAEDAATATRVQEQRRQDNEERQRLEAEERERQKKIQEEKYQEESLPEGQTMLEDGCPRVEVHHRDDVDEQKEHQQQKTESGCCCVVS